jgi:PAS domain S-box-containing protein
MNEQGNASVSGEARGLPLARAPILEDALIASLLNAAPDAMVTVDGDGRMLLVNAQTEKLFGYDRAELIGQPVELLLPERYREHHAGHRADYARVPRLRPMGIGLELFGRRKNGSEFRVEISLSPIETPAGPLVTSAIRDITERVQAQRRLAVQFAVARILAEAVDVASASLPLLQAIGENLDLGWGGLWQLDPGSGRIHCTQTWAPQIDRVQALAEVNQALTFERGSGMPGTIWESREPLWIADLAASTIFTRRDVAVGAGFNTVLGFPIVLDGEVVGVMEFFGQAIPQPDRDLLALLEAISRQISQFVARRRAEEQIRRQAAELARSNADLEQFAYVASHDLQEPLRMVASYTQLLARRYRSKLDADADEFIAFAVDGANRMQALIQDLLSYSRVGTRGKPFRPVNCAAVVDRVLNDLKPMIVEAGATVTRGDLPAVSGDDVQLGALFQNLIANAIKFRGDRAPVVQVSAEREGEHWRFAVQDNGIGIESEYRERIFVIFQRLHGHGTYPGTGIGLAICKRIVERHGGRIWVESTPGAGATFWFTLGERQDAR